MNKNKNIILTALIIIGAFLVVFKFTGLLFPKTVVAQEEAILAEKVIPREKELIGKIDLHTEYDYRAFVFDAYFATHDSPLQGHGRDFVKACDKYGAPYDCTTLLAIGWVETRNCTLANSLNERNCWGWGGAGENRVHFNSFEESIDFVIHKLMTLSFYGEEFMNDPVVGQLYYCGQHCHQYGGHVQDERERISAFAEELGFPPLIEK